MNEGLDKLKSIGAQKIHEATHISRIHVQAILHDSFDDMNQIQFLGFISILEREYSIDLTELKDRGLEYFNTKRTLADGEPVKVFVSSRKRNLTLFYIAVGLLIFIVFTFLNITSSKSNVTKVDNSAIENAKSNILIDSNESNQTEETNSSVLSEEQEVIKSEIKNEIVSLKITPNNEVWLGYIDLSTYKKYQKTFSDQFELDPSKDWLLAFGHGRVNIEINGIIKKFDIGKNIRFSYINSELKEIDFTEFKNLNRGRGW